MMHVGSGQLCIRLGRQDLVLICYGFGDEIVNMLMFVKLFD